MVYRLRNATRNILKYLEDIEDVKVGLSELKEQLDTPEESVFFFMQSAKQARNESGQKLFQIFRQKDNEVYIASLARRDTKLKGLVELKRRCQEPMQEVKLLSERQEVLACLVEDRTRLQSNATEKYYETIFEELRELVQKKSKEALVRVQKKHILSRCENERDRARMLQRLEGIRHWTGTRDIMSVESCSSSMTDDMEEVCSESSRKMKDVEETTSRASWTTVKKGKQEVWRLESEGERRSLKS